MNKGEFINIRNYARHVFQKLTKESIYVSLCNLQILYINVNLMVAEDQILISSSK